MTSPNVSSYSSAAKDSDRDGGLEGQKESEGPVPSCPVCLATTHSAPDPTVSVPHNCPSLTHGLCDGSTL